MVEHKYRAAWWLGGIGLMGAGALSLGGWLGFLPFFGPVEALERNLNAQLPAMSQAEVRQSLREAHLALEAGRAAEALERLQGLEEQWPAIADLVLMMRGMAYEKASSPLSAERTWAQLFEAYPESALAARALMGLGRLEELLQRYPAHPATALALQQAIRANPTNYGLYYDLARHHPQADELAPLLNRWVEARRERLSGDEWQAIADAYWMQKEYGKASRAYAFTPATSQNLYRRARSHQISNELDRATPIFKQLFAQYPQSEDATRGRLRWSLTSDRSTALALLRQVANLETDDAPGALLRMSEIYDRFNAASARATRQELIRRFPTTRSAGKAAWNGAFQLAKAGQLNSAISQAEAVADRQLGTEEGAQLRYWAGKWREQLGDRAGAVENYRRTLREASHAYYAWRAAEQLGYPVGNFTVGRTVVNLTYEPALEALPNVSETVQTLHLADLPDLAWQQYQWETLSSTEPSLAEQFAVGVLRNRADERLEGINQVTRLLFEADATQLEPFKQRPDFWQTVYPMHHFESLASNGKQFGINPLLLAGLIRQESRFEPEIVSAAGALGLTQVMPATGQWISGQIGQSSYDLTEPADNLRFGSFYLDYTHRRNADNSMLAVAGYNGGPGNVDKWVARYGLSDPDLFVESIPFPETRKYVKTVFGNYWNYFQLYSTEGEATAVDLRTQLSS
ncbi:MAG: transglycosylase SLT domain-containing protein [Cyanobacteria bacterium P01_D01_bin.123]